MDTFDLKERWDHAWKGHQRDLTSPRAAAHLGYRSPTIPYLLEGYDIGVTLLPIEVRNPFMDIRLLNYLLSLPALPWCFKKRLFRLAMRDLLPRKVCNRPKSPLRADPLVAQLRRQGLHAMVPLNRVTRLESYVNLEAIPRWAGTTSISAEWWSHLRPYCLDHWMRSSVRSDGAWLGGGPQSPSTSPRLRASPNPHSRRRESDEREFQEPRQPE